MDKTKNRRARDKADRANRGNVVAWVALAVSLVSLLISGAQYFQTQRPKLRFHPNSRLIGTTTTPEGKQTYNFGFVFENSGNLECRGVDILGTILTRRGKLGTFEEHTRNEILPDSVFHTTAKFDVPPLPPALGETEPSDADDILFQLILRYPAFPFGKHQQTFCYYFCQATQDIRHCDLPQLAVVKRMLE